MDGDDFEEIFVLVHEFFESGISSPRGYILGRGGFAAEDSGGGDARVEGGGDSFESSGGHFIGWADAGRRMSCRVGGYPPSFVRE